MDMDLHAPHNAVGTNSVTGSAGNHGLNPLSGTMSIINCEVTLLLLVTCMGLMNVGGCRESYCNVSPPEHLYVNRVIGNNVLTVNSN